MGISFKPRLAASAYHGGGVLMNFLLAIPIYSMIFIHWGDSFAVAARHDSWYEI